MQFSIGCEYAIHGMLFLAMRPENDIVLVNDIARAQNLPESYLAKVFQLLARGGLLRSFRGSHGGYMLALPPERITLKDIAVAIEGNTPLFSSLSNKRECSLDEDCLIRAAFTRAEESLYRELEKVTLREMTDRAKSSRSRMKWLQNTVPQSA